MRAIPAPGTVAGGPALTVLVALPPGSSAGGSAQTVQAPPPKYNRHISIAIGPPPITDPPHKYIQHF